jgi:hypothetical protein
MTYIILVANWQKLATKQDKDQGTTQEAIRTII